MINPYNRKTLKEMFDGHVVSPILPYISLDADRETADLIAKGNGRISLSGVQPKYSMVADNGRLRLTKEGEQGRYILKPAPTALFILDKAFCPANEFLTMQLAKEVYGIETAPCCLCEFGNGQLAYLVRRFDVLGDGTKMAQEDFAQLAGLSKDTNGEDYKYDVLSYEDCAELIVRYVKAAPVALLKFFRIVIFNYLILNDDAHLKNFSIIEQSNGDYVMTPAYDLMNTSLHLSQPSIFALKKGLFKEGMTLDDTHGINKDTFMTFGRRIGLPEKVVDKELKMFAKDYPHATGLIEGSYLSDELKKDYIASYKYRCFTISQ